MPRSKLKAEKHKLRKSRARLISVLLRGYPYTKAVRNPYTALVLTGLISTDRPHFSWDRKMRQCRVFNRRHRALYARGQYFR